MDVRFFIIPVILGLAAVVEMDNRNVIRKEFPEGLKGYHSVFFALVACAVIAAVLMFLNHDYHDEYFALQEKYNDLEVHCEILQDDYDSLESAYNELLEKENP